MTEESELRVDPNTADSESLVKLPGIGPELVKRSVDELEALEASITGTDAPIQRLER